MTIPIKTYTGWLNNVMSSETLRGTWFTCDSAFQHFLEFNIFPDVKKRDFKKRMSTLCKINENVYHKRVYNKYEKKYIDWYLFVTDKNSDYNHIVTNYTNHSDRMLMSTRTASNVSTNSDEIMKIKSDRLKQQQEPIFKTKWTSPEALKYFMPSVYIQRKKEKNSCLDPFQEVKIKNHLQAQLKLLRDGWLYYNEWRNVIDDGDVDDLYTDRDIFLLRHRCKHLYFAIASILKNYCFHTISECIQLSLDNLTTIETMGVPNTTYKSLHPITIMRWYNQFNKQGSFSNCHKSNGKPILPLLLSENIDLKNALLSFCYENLSILSAELLHNYLFSTALPTLLQKRKLESSNNDITMEQLLQEHNLQVLHVRTVSNWMNLLGFKFCSRKKNYYNDKHESESNVAYRMEFIARYFKYELLAHRWVQIPLLLYENMVKNGEVFSGIGFKYENEKGQTYMEFHVDDHPMFSGMGSLHPFGGNLSVRRDPNEKPLMIWGQDECIYRQFIFRMMCWIGANGETPLMPKTEGQGLMISGLVSREYGFGWSLSKKQLVQVNEYRKNKHYCDEKSAKAKFGKTSKDPLRTSPFKRELQYGALKEGYWSYEDMILQIEDCIDCLRALHGEKYQYLFLFDHSNGHDQMSEDALSSTLIRKNFGGSQPFMRSSLIKDSSYLGPYTVTNKLNIGETQSMQFTENDIGPFYLTAAEKIERKYDKVVGTKTVKVNIPDLIEALKQKGIKDPKGSKEKLQNMCKKNNIPITHEIPDIREGWVGKQKGSFQLLYERGWIDPCLNPKEYSLQGPLDIYGNRCESKSIKRLISIQPDFIQQETLLQTYCRKLGAISDRTPVAHCEIAGEGIEFDWGFSKTIYRSKPLEDKQNKTKFQQLVRSVLASDVLTLEVCRANARRARQYMLAYVALNDQQKHQSPITVPASDAEKTDSNLIVIKQEGENETKITHSLIENCVGLFRKRRTHRNTMDFDGKYLKSEILKNKILKDVVDKMSTFPKLEQV